MTLWGKEKGLPGRYPLPYHLLDAAAAAHVLWETYVSPGMRAWLAEQLELSEDDTRRFLAFLAGIHDIGKACPCFQHGWPAPGAADYIRHDTAGYLAVPTLLAGLVEPTDPFVDSVAHRIGEVVGGHHGLFWPVNRRLVRHPLRDARLGGADWQGERRLLLDTLVALIKPVLPARFPRAVAAVVTGLVILADWIVSDTEWITTSQWDAPIDLADRWDHTVTALEARVRGLRLSPPELAATVSTEMLIGRPPNPLQRSIQDEFHPTGPGLLLMLAATGTGKTEATFLAAARIGQVTGRPGMAVCLPTQATTNAMWQRGVTFEKAASRIRGPVTMAHSMAGFHEPYRAYCADDAALHWLNGRHKPLLAGLSVVTVDQVLIAALATRHNMLRLWALTGKTLVVDEVHAYEPYMLALLGRVLSWCGHLGVPVVLISATLPGHIAQELTTAYLTGANPHQPPHVATPAYPGWVWHAADGTVHAPSAAALAGIRTHGRRHARLEHVRYPVGRRATVITEYARRAVADSGCVAVVCATVASAQATYTHLHGVLPADVPMWLLHSRFPHRQRSRIEARLMAAFGKRATRANGRRPVRGIVISTPIIEQSLDLDFDVVISDLAPIALLIQRLGRCWRHPRDPGDRPAWLTAPTLIVLDPLVEAMPAAWRAIYPDYELIATRRVLTGRGPELWVPDQVDELVQAVHHRGLPPIDGDAAAAWRDQHATTAHHRALAEVVATPPPHLVDDLARITRPEVDDADATTRLGVDTARLVPQYRDPDGRAWLDAAHTVPFPGTHLKPHQLITVINASVRCPASWAATLPAAPARWSHPLLRHARILPAPRHDSLRLDPHLGLMNGTPHDDEL